MMQLGKYDIITSVCVWCECLHVCTVLCVCEYVHVPDCAHVCKCVCVCVYVYIRVIFKQVGNCGGALD